MSLRHISYAIDTGNTATPIATPIGDSDVVNKSYLDDTDEATRTYVDDTDEATRTYVDDTDAATRIYIDSLAGPNVTVETINLEFLGPWSNTVTVPFKFVKIGRIVTMSWPQFGAVATSTTTISPGNPIYSDVLAVPGFPLTGPVPEAYRPLDVLRSMSVRIFNNGDWQDQVGQITMGNDPFPPALDGTIFFYGNGSATDAYTWLLGDDIKVDDGQHTYISST
jgi:hypothetical protein